MSANLTEKNIDLVRLRIMTQKKILTIATLGCIQFFTTPWLAWAQEESVPAQPTEAASAQPSEATPPGDPAPQERQSVAVEASAPSSPPPVTPKQRNVRELDATLRAVLNTLIEQGTLTPEQVQTIVDSAEQEAQQPQVVEEAGPKPGEKIIRVPYVPENVKNQIRDEVRAGLREDTIDGVLSQAKQERWGMPGVTPEWVDRIKVKGDFRLRAQMDDFATGNQAFSYFNYNKINETGDIAAAGNDAYLNTTEDRERLRIRARVGVEAAITPKLKTAFRLATGGTSDPVSTNQTLGNSFNGFTVAWDQAYLRYDDFDLNGFTFMTLSGGRMPNPFFTTDLLFDDDLNFDGLAGTYRFNLRSSDDLMDLTEHDRVMFVTAGAFPLQEVELSEDDKWLYGAQVGFEFIANNQSTYTVAMSYFDYENIVGRRNTTVGNTDLNYTSPQFFQKGNTVFNIANSATATAYRAALASDYAVAAITFAADFSNFAPHHVILSLDYLENVAFDAAEVASRVGQEVEERTSGYQVGITVGWPQVTYPRRWRVQFTYKRLERDAVVDAFTDSDFHLGGTDAKGYTLKGEYGIADNTWVTLRYLTADAIDYAPFGVDTVQLDISTKF